MPDIHLLAYNNAGFNELKTIKVSFVNSIDAMEAFLDAVDLPGVIMTNVDCSIWAWLVFFLRKSNNLKVVIATSISPIPWTPMSTRRLGEVKCQ